MFTHNEVLANIEQIRRSEDTVLRKIRRLLYLKRRIRKFLRSLEKGFVILENDGDGEAANRLQRTIRSLRECLYAVQWAALELWRGQSASDQKMGFGYPPRWDAYPQWNLRSAEGLSKSLN